MPYFKKLNTLFIHIPKTGGTSIETTLYDREDQSDRYTEASLWMWPSQQVTKDRRSLQHHTLRELREYLRQVRPNEESIVDRARCIFAVVRNPYDRIVSEFHMRNRTTINRSALRDAPFLRARFAEFCRLFLTETANNDGHHIPQYEFLVDEQGGLDQRVHILRFETLADDFKRLFGFPIAYHMLKSDRVLPYSMYYDAQTRDLVSRYYRKDFEIFGYDTTLPVASESKGGNGIAL